MDKDNLSKIAKLKQLQQNKENQAFQGDKNPYTFNFYDYVNDNDNDDSEEELDKDKDLKDKKWNIYVDKVEYVDNILQFKVKSIRHKSDTPDLPLLNKIAPDVFQIKRKTKNVKNKKYADVYLNVQGGKEQDFLQCLPEIQKTLEEIGVYYKKSIITFIRQLGTGVEETPTPREIDDVNKAMNNSWKELLLMLKDPETRKRFLAFQTTVTCGKYFNSHLSQNNIMEVLSQDNFATFVTDKQTWFNKFNRRVKDGAKRILITKPYNNTPSKNALNNHEISQEYGGYNNVVRMSTKKHYGVAYSINKDVSKATNPNFTTYLRHVVYDVRDTELIEGASDPFLEIPNMINNLTGEVNKLALKFIDDENKKRGIEDGSVKKHEGIDDIDTLIKYKNILLKKCKQEGITIVDVGEPSDVIGECIYQYGLKTAEAYNILVPKEKELFAHLLCYCICSSFNIVCNKAKLSIKYIDSLTQEKAEIYAAYIRETYAELCAIRLYESKQNKMFTTQDIKNLILKFVNPKNKLKEEFIRKFINLTDRMNNVPK